MVKDEEPVNEARARGNVYGLLALAFYPPTKGAGDVHSELMRLLRVLPRREAVIPYPSPGPDLVALETEYNRLFVGPGHVVCPPYESVYQGGTDSPHGSVLGPSSLQVRAEYADAGLGFSEGFTDLPDHVSVELEFMKFLCEKEADDSDRGRSKWRSRQARFSRGHIERWLPGFADSVLKSTSMPFYKAAASLLRDFLALEREGPLSEPA